MENKVSVVIPVFNEEQSIQETIRALMYIHLIGEIIIVDDGSTDQTAAFIQRIQHPKIQLIGLETNGGKGAALRKGVERCRYPIIAFVDGDVGNTASEIMKLIFPILQGRADVSIAKFPKASQKGGVGIVKYTARKAVYWYTGAYIENVLCGQRAFRKEVLRGIEIPDGFGVEVGMTIDIIKNQYKIVEIPVDMTHKETGRTFAGFVHRGKQWFHIMKVLARKYPYFQIMKARW